MCLFRLNVVIRVSSETTLKAATITYFQFGYFGEYCPGIHRHSRILASAHAVWRHLNEHHVGAF